MITRRFKRVSIFCLLMCGTVAAVADEEMVEVQLTHRRFRVPAGFRIEQVVSTELAPRPINACFDWDGNLYVTDSSGSNEPVQVQLEKRPHRVLKLVDKNRDGQFETCHVFADRMMFPEGVLWFGNALYVSAPPQIWRLQDVDGDGVCDRREVWFDGKTLTGCANDLHGPYLGRDGWIYWCKGAFAEQTHELVEGRTITSRAAHIFRRRPTGGPIDLVMTGGMDNPVDVVMSTNGDRFFSTTFLQHPAGGHRDGLLHVVQGGLYGKRHGVLDSHPKTGLDLMPVMTHLGPAAPSGLSYLEAGQAPWQGSLVAACFNLHQITRHVLEPLGSTYASSDSVLVDSTDLDFHPTDVIEDADGSLLIVDTGGWYKLCCPSSQLHKPDELGGIYRLVPPNLSNSDDPRGRQLDWSNTTDIELCNRISDSRWVVRDRAIEVASTRPMAVPILRQRLNIEERHTHRLHLLWALSRIDSREANEAVLSCLDDVNEEVKCAALQIVATQRNGTAARQVRRLLSDPVPAVRRRAAETIAQLDLPNQRERDALVAAVLEQLSAPQNDRVLHHALTYALLRLEANVSPKVTDPAARVRSLLMVQQQRSPDSIEWDVLADSLTNDDDELRRIAAWIVRRHPEWKDRLLSLFFELAGSSDVKAVGVRGVAQLLGAQVSKDDAIRKSVCDWLRTNEADRLGLDVVQAIDGDWPVELQNVVAQRLMKQESDDLVGDWLRLVGDNPKRVSEPDLITRLVKILESTEEPDQRRVIAGAALQNSGIRLSDEVCRWLTLQIVSGRSTDQRLAAAHALVGASLTEAQLKTVVGSLPRLGVIEFREVITVLLKGRTDALGALAIAALGDSAASRTIPDTDLKAPFKNFSSSVHADLDAWLAARRKARAKKDSQLPQRLAALPAGDIQRGQLVFHHAKTACFACHRMGYRGGDIGPDLTRIGRIRSKAELFEAITMPNSSVVRSFESFVFVTTEGKSYTGLVRDETESVIRLIGTDRKEVTLNQDEIETRSTHPTSIMPSGLDEVLDDQELADLLAFLSASK